jgi:hypothetical protein
MRPLFTHILTIVPVASAHAATTMFLIYLYTMPGTPITTSGKQQPPFRWHFALLPAVMSPNLWALSLWPVYYISVLTRQYSEMIPEPVMPVGCFLPVLRHHKLHLLSGSLYHENSQQKTGCNVFSACSKCVISLTLFHLQCSTECGHSQGKAAPFSNRPNN